MPPAELRLTPAQQDALRQIAAAAMRASSEVLSDLILRTVEVGEPYLSGTTWDELGQAMTEPVLVVRVEYVQGVQGSNLLVMRPADAARVAALMMGEDQGAAPSLDELHLSAVSEAMNQMMGASATALSQLFGRTIIISPPTTALQPFSSANGPLLAGSEPGADLVQVAFPIRIADDVDAPIESLIVQLFPGDFARRLSDEYLAMRRQGAPADAPAPPVRAAAPAAAPARAPASAALGAKANPGAAAVSTWQPDPLEEEPAQGHEARPEGPEEDRISFELIKRITVPVTVRLGQAHLSLQDVLSLTRGSIVQLDTADGEPVDVLVSGTLVARGEVVVVRERFGVRITELVRPELLPGGSSGGG